MSADLRLAALALARSLGMDAHMTKSAQNPVSWIAVAGAVLSFAVSSPAHARDVLGVFDGWGAFRDVAAARCFAITKPVIAASTTNLWRPFAAIGYWPRKNARGQVNIRLSRELAPKANAVLTIGDRRFPLTGAAADVWAVDKQGDAAIVAAIRSGSRMTVTGKTQNGKSFTDHYRLRGAASAIDSAALGCARMK